MGMGHSTRFSQYNIHNEIFWFDGAFIKHITLPADRIKLSCFLLYFLPTGDQFAASLYPKFTRSFLFEQSKFGRINQNDDPFLGLINPGNTK